MNQTRIAEVEDALVELLKAKLPDVKNIGALTEGDINEEDQIVTDTPAIRMFFGSEQFDRARDLMALTYQSGQSWTLLCGAQNQRDLGSERKNALDLLSRVLDALAGARLVLPAQTQGAQVVLKRAGLLQTGPDGTWYLVEFAVESIVQFTGNAA